MKREKEAHPDGYHLHSGIPSFPGTSMQNLMGFCLWLSDKKNISITLEQILSPELQASQNLRFQRTALVITKLSLKYSRPVLSKRTLSFKPRRSSGIPERKTRILMDPTISLRNTFPLALTWTAKKKNVKIGLTLHWTTLPPHPHAPHFLLCLPPEKSILSIEYNSWGTRWGEIEGGGKDMSEINLELSGIEHVSK